MERMYYCTLYPDPIRSRGEPNISLHKQMRVYAVDSEDRLRIYAKIGICEFNLFDNKNNKSFLEEYNNIIEGLEKGESYSFSHKSGLEVKAKGKAY